MKKIALLLGSYTIFSLFSLIGMEKNEEALVTHSDSEPQQDIRSLIAQEVTRQLDQRQSSAQNLSKKTVAFIRKHPLEIGAGVAALIAVPALIYWFRQPSFSFKDAQYKSFYQKTLSPMQRDSYKHILLNVDNPFSLIDHSGFRDSVSPHQKIELLSIFKKHSAQIVIPDKEASDYNTAMDYLSLCRARCGIFEQVLLNELDLQKVGSEIVDGYTTYYATSGLPVQCTSAFEFPRTFAPELPPSAQFFNARNYAAAFNTKIIYVWSQLTGKCLALIDTEFSTKITHIVMDRSGKNLAAVSSAGDLFIYSFEQQKSVRWNYKNDGIISAVTFNHDGSQLVTGTARGMVKLWDYSTHKPIKSLQLKETKSISALSIHRYHGIFIISQGRALIWEPTDSPESIKEPDPSLTFLAEGQELLAYDADCILLNRNEITLVHYKTGETKKLNSEDSAHLFGSEDQRYFGVTTSTGLVELWDSKKGECILRFNGLADTLILSFGGSPHELFGVGSTHKVVVLRNWSWQEAAPPDQWLHLLAHIGITLHPSLTVEDVERIWGPYCVEPLSDPVAPLAEPYVLLGNTAFLAALATTESKTLFSQVLHNFRRDYCIETINALFKDRENYRVLLLGDIRSLTAEKNTLIDFIHNAGQVTAHQKTALANLRIKVLEFETKQKDFEKTYGLTT